MDTIRRVAPQVLPIRPFLGRIFEDRGVMPRISAGFHYSPDEAKLLGRIHRAVDVAVPRGTRLMAPHDGWYMASYGEKKLLDKNGHPQRVYWEDAIRMHPKETLAYPPGDDITGYFGSLIVQGYLGGGRYIQIAHLDGVVDAIPYHRETLLENGNRLHSPELRCPIAEMKDGKAVFLKRGHPIGWSGMSGCGWGTRHYDLAPKVLDGRPDFRGVNYAHYDEPHVHVALFWGRRPFDRAAVLFVDPFGVYSDDVDEYPKQLKYWDRWPGSLWLPQV